MRNKSMSSSRSIARLMVLALCFVMVFTMAFVIIGQMDFVNDDVAIADNEDDNEAKGGIASVTADQGVISADLLTGVNTKVQGFPGTSTETQWTTTITFNNATFGSNNVSNFLSSGSDNVGGVVGGTGSFTATEFDEDGKESDHGLFSPHLYSIVNYTFSDFMLKLMASSNYTVTATMTSTLKKNESTSSYNDIHFLLLATSSKVKAKEGAQDNGVNIDINDGNVKSAWTSASLKSGSKQATTGAQTFTAKNCYLVMGWETQSGWNNHCDYTISNISITFTITLDTSVADSNDFYLSDGAAPVASSQYSIANDYSKGVSGSGYAPNIQDASESPVYYSSIEGKIKLDNVSNGAGKLQSYTNTVLSQIEGKDYYKYAQTEYVDLYNYSSESSIATAIKKYGGNAATVIGAGDRVFNVDSKGNITATATADDVHLHYASGIKTVTVNDTTFNMWDSTDYSKTKEITVKDSNEKDVTIGYAQVKYLNRSRVVVMLYMTGNGTVQTTVTDYGGLSNKTKLVVSGIDTQSPNADTEMSLDSYVGASSFSGVDWYRDDRLNDVDISFDSKEDTTEAGYSPYIWFYSVKKADSASGCLSLTPYSFADYSAVKDSGILPIACGDDISKFVYDFTTGFAQALGGSQGGTPTGQNVAGPKGSGYYQFTFYSFDLAGNMGKVNSYYMKVDYETVNYTLDLSFGNGTIIKPSGTKTLAENEALNGTWATSDITLKIKVENSNTTIIGKDNNGNDITWDSPVGFSGYTLAFMIDEEYHVLVVDGKGETSRTDYSKPSLVKYISPSSEDNVSNNTYTIKGLKTDVGSSDVVVKYDPDTNTFTFTITAKENVNFAWITTFETAPGQYVANDIEDVDRYCHDDWKDGVQMLVDCTSPENPVIADVEDSEDAYIYALGGYDKLPTDRVWYTGSFKAFPASISFYDDIIDSNYADKINVYYCMAIVSSLSQLQELGNKNLENQIKNGTFENLKDLAVFNGSGSFDGNNFDSKSYDISLSLVAGKDAGMRVFYVWAEDQAGNKSDVGTYYLLADANAYKISASVNSDSALKKGTSNISFTNAEKVATTTFNRGETVLFSLGVEDGYAPFSLKMNGEKLLENYLPEAKNWTEIGGTSKYISTDEYSSVTYVVDDSENLGKLDVNQKFEFAHRKIVSYEIVNTKVDQTAKITDVLANTTFSDSAAKKIYNVAFVNSSNLVLYVTHEDYKDADGVTTANAEHAEKDEDGNPVYYVPSAPGKYRVALYIDRENSAYVDKNNNTDKTINMVDDYEIIEVIIIKRTIDADSFVSIIAVDRDYNGSNIVDVKLELKDGVLASGDTIISIGLEIKGVLDDKNAGIRRVVDLQISLADIDGYELDAESIKNRFTVDESVEAEISKVLLTPVIPFDELTYNGNANIASPFSVGEKGKFTTKYAQDEVIEAILNVVYFDTNGLTFALSRNGAENANVQTNGKHSVFVYGLTIGFDGATDAQKEEFKNNFRLDGSRYSIADNQYIAITDIDEGLVEDFELIDYVVLNKKDIVLITNDFKIADKVYDGTNNASITISIEDSEGNQRFVANHAELLEIVASGVFENIHARDNLKVTVDSKSVVLQVNGNLNDDDKAIAYSIIGNYNLVLNYDPEIYGNIKPRLVDITVSFKDQEYNGQENVQDGRIVYGNNGVLDGVLDKDKTKVNIFTEGNAYYIDKNVVLDANGNVIAKMGTAYGIVLSSGETNDYTAVNKSIVAIAGRTLVAYLKTNGEYVYASSVANGDEVACYYYALNKTQKYLVISDENADKIEQARKDNAIVGFKIIDGKDVYMLALGYEVDGALSLAQAITYMQGEGKITQRVIRISSSGIQKEDGAEAFVKKYDGTTKFFGVQSYYDELGNYVKGDYKITSEAISNVVLGDKVSIKSVTAVFETARVGTINVVFTASGITGEDASNYTVDGKGALTANISAKIEPLTIDAALQDATRIYGATKTPSNVVYTLNGNELTLVGRKFYMNYNEWLLTTGFISDANSTVSEADQKYVDELSARRYNLVDGEFVQTNDGEYIVIGGSNDAINELPEAKAVFTSTKPNAGTKASSYTLSEGKAVNYVFNPIYTGEGTSTLEIVKKTVYIVTETKDFAKTYGSANPEVSISVLDASGANGFVGDQWNGVFKIGSVDYGPVAKLGIFNRSDGTITAVDEYAKISADLGDDEVYVFYLAAPEGANYDNIANYTIIYQDINSVSLDNGNAVWKLAGADFTKSASTLTITLPELTGISVGSSEENVFTYSKDVNWINEVLRGELATDEVRFLIDGVESEAINAGVYEGKIIVKRYISANGDFVKDKNGYYIEWNSGDTNVKITVNRQTINLWAYGMSVYYDGSEQSYLDSKLSHTAISDETGVTALGKEDYTISYEVYDSKTNTYVATKSVKDAGRYRVTIALTDKFEQKHPNLANGSSVKADLYVLKAIVNVTISKDGYTGGSTMVDNNKVTSLSAMFDANAKYEIGYSVAMDDKSNASNIAVSKGQTKLVLSKNGESMSIDQIHEAGKYTFAIVLDDESLDENNYTINGGSGILELTVNKISDSNGNGIDLGEGTITANRLVVKEVTNGSTLANDAAYLATIKQHVASLSKQAGYEDEARLAAVYRLTLYCDDKVVTPDGAITVSVAMPDTIDSMDGIVLYTVTADGGLQKLTDYKVEDGKIVYSADYVSGIVFVDTNPEGLASWIIYTIVAVVSFIVLVVVATVLAIVIRKARLKRLD